MVQRRPALMKDIFYAVGAQAVSLSASVAVSFLLPKVIGAADYAYWQLFLFYVTYINLSRLGLLDGLYLRLGGREYEELEHPLLACEWRLFLGFQCIAAAAVWGVLAPSMTDPDRTFVLAACCVCMVLINSNNFFSYVLQAVNQTRRYSVSVMIQNLFWFLAVAAVLLFRLYTYKVIVGMYVAGHAAAGAYLARGTRALRRPARAPASMVWADIRANIRCGLVLMLSVYAGNFVLGSARMVIDRAWGVEMFGYVSFALTLANCVLAFINRVSVVLFPALRRVKAERQAEACRLLSDLLDLFLPAVLLGYLPICLLVRWWLPQYTASLPFLVYFLPVCAFDGRMQLLCSTYFKALRRERLLLVINCITAAASGAAAWAGSYLAGDIRLAAAGLMAAVILRSLVSEALLARMLRMPACARLAGECALAAVYLATALCLPEYAAFGVYLVAYLGHLWLRRGRLREIWQAAAAGRTKKGGTLCGS